MKKFIYPLFFIIFLFSLTVNAIQVEQPPSNLYKWLKSRKNITVTKIPHDSLFSEGYRISIKQPLDHFSEENNKFFKQKIYLYNINPSLPVVFVTEGYSANTGTAELSKILNANQITVEHRYFGDSVPDSLDWKNLTIQQAAADHHTIIELFNEYYTGKWVSTGISKGGQTSIYHRRFYPDDVDVTIPYVAPLNFEQEEPRIYTFLDSVGSDECGEKITNYQRYMLKNKNDILPIFKDESKKLNYTYPLGDSLTYEYIVLEYSFAFWQWGYSTCDDIPTDTVNFQKAFAHLEKVVPFYYFSDKGANNLKPFFYQAYTQLGFYGYKTDKFNGLLSRSGNYSNIYFAPEYTNLRFDKNVMKDVNDWLQDYGNNFIFIYGGNDTWSASAVNLSGKTNSIKMVLKNGSHRTRIKDFTGQQKDLIYKKLEKWLEQSITNNKKAGN